MFGKKSEPDNPLWRIRSQLLTQIPDNAASLVAPATSVWGVLMETGYAQGPVSLIVVGDGTTSLYYPTGGGVIGAGQHVPVAAASMALLVTANAVKAAASPADNTDFPQTGRVRLYILTTDGVLSADEAEQVLGNGAGPLSALFHAAHAVISQIRILTQKQ